MENNEITMFLYVKMDIHDKRNEAHKFKVWTKCQVKIEAIKCLPCFLRLTFKPADDNDDDGDRNLVQQSFTVSINVPGVTISLATSRTKQFSYGLFWTHNRRDCFIYFALDTDASCRKHMKWIKKSIKNLELYRQVFLEQRRNSRGLGNGFFKENSNMAKVNEISGSKVTLNALGPLPKIPDSFDVNCSSWSRRVSRASAIYEEIFESSRISRRVSRASIASGIYEEMKPTTAIEKSCNMITEESFAAVTSFEKEQPPPVPPLPPIRKRINTFANDGILGEIPRSNTNPESELAKKKKYKVMLDNLFGGRSKRAESVSEAPSTTVEDLINEHKEQEMPIYMNDIVATKRLRQPRKLIELAQTKRNSFSSPDLSKINFFDTFDEECVADILQNSFTCSDESDLSLKSLDEAAIAIAMAEDQRVTATVAQFHSKSGSADSLNISEQIPINFNFSACNTSSINLVGANGAGLQQTALKKHNVLIDDLTGYCVMAPILKKISTGNAQSSVSVATSTESTSSGYSTGSYSSTISTCTNSIEDATIVPLALPTPTTTASTTTTTATTPTTSQEIVDKIAMPIASKSADESNIYENMCGSANNSSKNLLQNSAGISVSSSNFSDHLYENLLTVKAAQELEIRLPTATISSSTPTESPQTYANIAPFHTTPEAKDDEEDSFYQTPRKSIISVDDKIPSYYPNSCDTIKMQRRTQSPNKCCTSPLSRLTSNDKTTNALGIKHLVSMKMQRERKENLYISSPQKILEDRTQTKINATTATQTKPTKTQKMRKTAAHKVADNVYTVRHINKKSQVHNNSNNNNNNQNQNYNNNNGKANRKSKAGFTDEMNEKLQSELLQLAMLQNIDFKFDDTKALRNNQQESPSKALPIANTDYENCYQAAESATRLLHKYATLAKYGGSVDVAGATATTSPTGRPTSITPKRNTTPQHHLQANQSTNMKQCSPLSAAMSQSSTTKIETPSTSNDLQQLQGIKKFASLPRFKKIDFSPLKMRINNVLQRNQQQQ